MTSNLALKIAFLLLIIDVANASFRESTSVEGLGRRERFLESLQNNDDINGNNNDDSNNDDKYGIENGGISGNGTSTKTDNATHIIQSNEPDASAMVEMVELLGFVVLLNNSTFQDLASAFEELLTQQLKREFDYLISIDLQLETQTISGRTRQSELVFSGFAAFNTTMSDQLVRDAQIRALQDSEAVRQVTPDLISIKMSNPAPVASPTASPTTSPTVSPNNLSLIIISFAGAAVALLFAAFFGYRCFCRSPAPSRAPVPHINGRGNQHPPPSPRRIHVNQQPVLVQEMAPTEIVLRPNSSNVNDVYSLDGLSTSAADLEKGDDMTEVYLMKRFQESQREHPALPSGPVDTDETFDDTDTGGFSYEFVGCKGTEWVDDIVAAGETGNGDGADGRTVSATVYDYENVSVYYERSLGRPFDESTMGDDAPTRAVHIMNQHDEQEFVRDGEFEVKPTSTCEDQVFEDPELPSTATSVEV